jgi:hypothetical protein
MYEPTLADAHHDDPKVDVLQREGPDDIADMATPPGEFNTSPALSSTSTAFWDTWSMTQGILDWYDGATRRRVSFADDAAPEPTKLGGCQCGEHKVYFNGKLAVSAFATIIRGRGHSHKQDTLSATMKLHIVYRHYHGRHYVDDDDDDDDSEAHSLVNPFEGEQLFRRKSEFTKEHSVAVFINDRAEAVSKARAVFSMLISE